MSNQSPEKSTTSRREERLSGQLSDAVKYMVENFRQRKALRRFVDETAHQEITDLLVGTYREPKEVKYEEKGVFVSPDGTIIAAYTGDSRLDRSPDDETPSNDYYRKIIMRAPEGDLRNMDVWYFQPRVYDGHTNLDDGTIRIDFPNNTYGVTPSNTPREATEQTMNNCDRMAPCHRTEVQYGRDSLLITNRNGVVSAKLYHAGNKDDNVLRYTELYPIDKVLADARLMSLAAEDQKVEIENYQSNEAIERSRIDFDNRWGETSQQLGKSAELAILVEESVAA